LSWEAEVPVSPLSPTGSPWPPTKQVCVGGKAQQLRTDRANPRHQSVRCRRDLEAACSTLSVLSLQALTRHRLENLSDHLLPSSLPAIGLPSLVILPRAPHPAAKHTGLNLEALCLCRHTTPLASMFFLLVSQACSPVTSCHSPKFCPQDCHPDRRVPSWECPSHTWT
jgi:hypothetical protein